ISALDDVLDAADHAGVVAGSAAGGETANFVGIVTAVIIRIASVDGPMPALCAVGHRIPGCTTRFTDAAGVNAKGKQPVVVTLADRGVQRPAARGGTVLPLHLHQTGAAFVNRH